MLRSMRYKNHTPQSQSSLNRTTLKPVEKNNQQGKSVPTYSRVGQVREQEKKEDKGMSKTKEREAIHKILGQELFDYEKNTKSNKTSEQDENDEASEEDSE